MNGRDGFTLFVSYRGFRPRRTRPDRHLRAVAQPVETVRRDHCTLLQSLHFRDVAIGRSNGDGFQRDGLIRLNHVDKRAIVVSLDCVVRQEGDAFVRIDQESVRLQTGSGRACHHRS